MLAPCVAVLVRGLQQRAANQRLVLYSMSILALLSYEPICKPERLKQSALPDESKRELALIEVWLANDGNALASARRGQG